MPSPKRGGVPVLPNFGVHFYLCIYPLAQIYQEVLYNKLADDVEQAMCRNDLRLAFRVVRLLALNLVSAATLLTTLKVIHASQLMPLKHDGWMGESRLLRMTRSVEERLSRPKRTCSNTLPTKQP